MPNCFKCGALYGAGDEFCPDCGEKLIVRRSNFLILIAIVVIIGVVLFFALKITKTSPTSSIELPTGMSTSVPAGKEEIPSSEENLEDIQRQAYEDEQRLKHEEELQQEEKQEKECKWGYTDEYKCDGKIIRRKWMSSDCSSEWFYYLTCYYGCENGKCIDKPIQEEPEEQCVKITNFHFNAAGDDNYNLNDEYVTFKNKCSYSIDMTGWTVRDQTAYHVYTFLSFTFGSGTTFTLYTGTGIDTNSALYWGRTSGDYAAIWNNKGGDTLFLRDSNGDLILTESYTGY